MKPFSNSDYIRLKAAKLNRWNLFTSSNSIITTVYILAKHLIAKDANSAIEAILKRLEIQDLSKKEIFLALRSKTDDLEDSCQIECASKIGKVDYIVTRDKKGFRNSTVELLLPDELLSVYYKSD